jgi:hypothetical protein
MEVFDSSKLKLVGKLGKSSTVFDETDPLIMGDNRGAYFDGRSWIEVGVTGKFKLEHSFSIISWLKISTDSKVGDLFATSYQGDTSIELRVDPNFVEFIITD